MRDVRWSDGVERPDDRWEHYDRLAREALALYRPTGTVLDVGCGTGWMERWLFTENWYGIDVRGRFRTNRAAVGDAALLPFRDSTFSAVVCHSVLQSIQSPETVLREISRVARPLARIGITVTVEADDPNFRHAWTARAALSMVSSVFKVQHVGVFPGLYPPDGLHLMITSIKCA